MSVGQDDVLGLAELVEGNDHHAEAVAVQRTAAGNVFIIEESVANDANDARLYAMAA